MRLATLSRQSFDTKDRQQAGHIGRYNTREKRVASVELSHDAGQAPHVNGGAVAQAQHDLWGAVEAALDVAVHLLPFKATAAKINHLHITQLMLTSAALFSWQDLVAPVTDDCQKLPGYTSELDKACRG